MELPIVAAAVPVHVALALATDLSPDEAYYLCAARAGSRVLVDHPPLTAWMLATSDHLTCLPVELRVRVWAILASFFTSLIVVALARAQGAADDGCRIVAWVTTWALLPMAGGFVTTPDTVLLLAVAVALLAAERSPVAAAAALAVGSIAKVTALPVAALLAAGVWAAGKVRAPRRSAVIIAFGPLLALPLLLPSLRFQLRHAFVSTGGWSVVASLGAVLAAVGAQLALWSPLAVWHGARALARGPVPAPHRVVAAGITCLVVVSALVRGLPPEPNWWAPAALAMVSALGVAASEMSATRRRVLLATLLAPTAVAVAHTLRPFLPLPSRADPTARLHGWSAGEAPIDAPGTGPYGPVAELCIYRGSCAKMTRYFNAMNH